MVLYRVDGYFDARSAELKRGDFFSEDAIAEHAASDVVAGSPDGDVQRQKMFGLGMALHSTWRGPPGRQFFMARPRIGVGDGIRQPSVEPAGFRIPASPNADVAHIVIAHAGADDQHAFIAQRLQSLADLQMGGGV